MMNAGPSRSQSGVTMIEVLVTLLVTAFGLLALAGFIGRASAMGVESNQRARAAAILTDMTDRMRNNKGQAATYVSATAHGAAVINCAGKAAGFALDLCEWNNLLIGTNDALSNGNAQALSFRGCINRPDVLLPVYVVTVAWGSSVTGVAPVDACGANLFGADDSFRRVIRSQVRIASLAA